MTKDASKLMEKALNLSSKEMDSSGFKLQSAPKTGAIKAAAVSLPKFAKAKLSAKRISKTSTPYSGKAEIKVPKPTISVSKTTVAAIPVAKLPEIANAKDPTSKLPFAKGGEIKDALILAKKKLSKRRGYADGGSPTDPMQQYAANLKAAGMSQAQIDAIIGSQTQQAPATTAAPATGSNPATAAPVKAAVTTAPTTAVQPQTAAATAPVTAPAPTTAAAQPQVSDLLTKYYGSADPSIASYINQKVQDGTYTMPQVDAWLQTPEAKTWYTGATTPAATTQKSGASPSLQTAATTQATATATTPSVTSLSSLPAKSTVFIQGNPYYITTPEEAKVMKANGTLPSNFMYASGLQNLGINNLIATGSNDFGGTHYVAYTPQTAAQYGLTYSANPTTTTPTTGGTTPTTGETGTTGTGPQQHKVFDQQAYDQAYQQWLNGYNQWKQQADVVSLQIATKQLGDWPSWLPKQYVTPQPNPASYTKMITESAPSKDVMDAFSRVTLGRDVSDTEAQQWADYVNKGLSNQQIFAAMSASPEAANYTKYQINDIYSQATGNPLTKDQVDSVYNDMAAGKFTLSQLDKAWNNTPQADAYRQQQVNDLFTTATGLSLTPEQSASISKDVQAGKYTLPELGQAWATSQYGVDNARQIYANETLKRDLTPQEKQSWQAYVDAGATPEEKVLRDQQVYDSIQNSPEILDNYKASSIQEAFGRDMTPQDSQKWDGLIQSGLSPEEARDTLLNSDEGKTNQLAQFVKDEYQGFQGKDPSPDQLNSAIKQLSQGMTREQFNTALRNDPKSQEYMASNFEPYQEARAGKTTSLQQQARTPFEIVEKISAPIANAWDNLTQDAQTTLTKLFGQESAGVRGDPWNAKAPKGSAAGIGQFIDTTWADTFAKLFDGSNGITAVPSRKDLGGKNPGSISWTLKNDAGDTIAQLTGKQVLNLRNDTSVAGKNLNMAMTIKLMEENANILQKQGIPATADNLYSTHFSGNTKLAKLAVTNPNAPISAALKPDQIAHNRDLVSGISTVGQLMDRIHNLLESKESLGNKRVIQPYLNARGQTTPVNPKPKPTPKPDTNYKYGKPSEADIQSIAKFLGSQGIGVTTKGGATPTPTSGYIIIDPSQKSLLDQLTRAGAGGSTGGGTGGGGTGSGTPGIGTGTGGSYTPPYPMPTSMQDVLNTGSWLQQNAMQWQMENQAAMQRQKEAEVRNALLDAYNTASINNTINQVFSYLNSLSGSGIGGAYAAGYGGGEAANASNFSGGLGYGGSSGSGIGGSGGGSSGSGGSGGGSGGG